MSLTSYRAAPPRDKPSSIRSHLCSNPPARTEGRIAYSLILPTPRSQRRHRMFAVLARLCVPRIAREHPIVDRDRFVEAAKYRERVGAIVQEIDVFGQELERALVALERLVVPAELRQHAAAIIERAWQIGA